MYSALQKQLPSPTLKSRFWVNSSRKLFWQSFSTSRCVLYPLHVHAEFNVVICLAGSVEVRQCGETEIAEAGEALIGNACISHESAYRTGRDGCEAVSLTVDAQLFKSAMSEVCGRGIETGSAALFTGKASSPQIRSIAHSIGTELQASSAVDSRRFELLAAQFLGATLREWKNQNILKVEPQSGQACLPRWQFVKTHEMMLASSKSDFTVHAMARQLGFSASRFHRLFRGATGESPAQYFANLTLGTASEQLRETNSQVKQISYDLGFNSPSHFCSAFRKRFGVSPLKFRENPIANAQ